jgi:hypothetical protein
LEKIEKKDAHIKLLERENLSKHTKLGVTQTKLAKMKSQLELNKGEITKLHQLAVSNCVYEMYFTMGRVIMLW